MSAETQTQTELLVRAETVRAATLAAENSAQRVGQLLLDTIESLGSQFGRVADVSSSYTAIVNAANLNATITAAAAGSAIQIPPGLGDVEVTTIALSGGKKLWSWGGTTFKWVSAAAAPMLTIAGTGCGLHNIDLDGNASNQTYAGEAVTTSAAPKFRMEGCKVTNFRARFFIQSVADSPDTIIEGCHFYSMGTVGNCDVLCLRSPRSVVRNCFFNDFYDGHAVRVGLFGGDATGTPVTGCSVEGCSFKTSIHNAVTLEIYAQHTAICGNYIDGVDQAVKCEAAGATVFGVTITGNTIKNIALSTALNLVVPGVTFTGNTCYDLAAGPVFSANAICADNYFERVGTTALYTCISDSGVGEVTITGNQIIDCPYRAIVVAGNSIVQDNYIQGTVDSAIRISGDGSQVRGNVVDGCTLGVNVVSGTTGAAVRGNTFKNFSSSAVSVNATSLATCDVGGNIGVDDPTVAFTIATGAIAIGKFTRSGTIATEGGAGTDDLDTITGGEVGQVIVLRPNSSSQDPTVRDVATSGGGNIHTAGAASFAMLTSAYRMGLQWSGTFWQELWRSTT